LDKWHSIAPLAEQTPAFSTYGMVLNNPVNFIDPDSRGVKVENGGFTYVGNDIFWA